jgi:hypothetical protein
MAIKENVEVMWFIYGLWIGTRFYGIKKFYGRGQTASVDFEWEKGNNPFVLGWIHTHPDNYGCAPSSTDDKTMRSWVRGLGRAMICAIRSNEVEAWYLYFRDVDKNISKINLSVKFKGNRVYGRIENEDIKCLLKKSKRTSC